MAVYVDDMHTKPMGRLGRMKMSHMVADTKAELLLMAQRIDIAARHIQKRDTPDEHFDISKDRRAKAIECGAIEVTMRQMAKMVRNRRLHGELGSVPAA